MDIQETTLPGVGLRHDFTTQRGHQLGVVSYRTGRRDLLLYDHDDPDACREVIRLSEEESDTLADLLGAARLTGHLAELQQQLEGLAISWLASTSPPPLDTRRMIALVRESPRAYFKWRSTVSGVMAPRPPSPRSRNF